MQHCYILYMYCTTHNAVLSVLTGYSLPSLTTGLICVDKGLDGEIVIPSAGHSNSTIFIPHCCRSDRERLSDIIPPFPR